jgi:ATP-dependent Clp protease ATP-binding subunit ClpA
MFERFTTEARVTVTRAQEEARRLGAPEIRPAHLMLALAGTDPDGRAGRLLAELGLSAHVLAEAFEAVVASERRAGLSNADVAALREIGIDVETIVDRVEQTWGPNALAPRPRPRTSLRRRLRRRRDRRPVHGDQGRDQVRARRHIPFSAEAKRILELTLRQALDIGDRHIGNEHLVLALLTGDSAITDALRDRDITYTDARARLARAPAE